jgi:hypothetical protein
MKNCQSVIKSFTFINEIQTQLEVTTKIYQTDNALQFIQQFITCILSGVSYIRPLVHIYLNKMVQLSTNIATF